MSYSGKGIIHPVTGKLIPIGSFGGKKRPPVSAERRARLGSCCAWCGATERLTIDHIVPWALCGVNDDYNLQILCEPCNHRKGSKYEATRFDLPDDFALSPPLPTK